MKKGGRLNRHTELKARKGLERTSGKKQRTPREREAASEWYREVVKGAKVCAVTGKPGTPIDPLEGHHVIEQEDLRKHASKHGLDLVALLWDPRNGMAVLRSRHAQHTNRFDRIPLEKVPQSAVEFAEEIGLDWKLQRDYAP